MMNLIKIGFLLLSVIITGCYTTSGLKQNITPVDQFVSTNKVIFIATKSRTGENITIAEILEEEKGVYGDDISLVNIVEQYRTRVRLIGKNKIEMIYMYDVVKYKNQEVISTNTQRTTMGGANLQKPITSNSFGNLKMAFEHNSTLERYYFHPDFISDSNQTSVDYNSARNRIKKYYSSAGFFLPDVEEMKMMYEQYKNSKFPIKIGIYWTADNSYGKVKCIDLSNGEVIEKVIDEKALFLPLRI